MANVLLIDDEQVIRELIAEILVDAGHAVVSAANAREGLDHIDDKDVDIVVSDIVMPGLSGLELLEEVRQRRPNLPVVLVTGAGTHAMLSDALAGGAAGLVMKPFSHAELQRSVGTALQRAAQAEIDLRERLLTPSLAGALANAIEARDATMHGHCERMSALAVRIAFELGLNDRDTETVRLGSIVHDVGKIGIPDRVLMKVDSLTDEELALMQTHPLIGDRLLEPLDLIASVREVVRHHHERWDGTGYPDRLAGERIPLAARIVAIADAVEAMSAVRRYRQPHAKAQIVRELELGNGAQWDPTLVKIVLELISTGHVDFTPTGLELSPTPHAAPERLVSVLLVDDDAGDAALVRDAVEHAVDRAVITQAGDAKSALDLCRTASWSLALVDQHLPDGSGLDLMQMLHDLSPALPIVMLSGDGSEEFAVEAFRHGASDYVVKRNGFSHELSGRLRALLKA
jgi:response regulator RpfG family c-di-GMP phosphodiesterase